MKMNRTGWIVGCVLMLAGCCLRADTETPAKAAERIGVYDSRAVAVAFCGSAAHNLMLDERKAACDKAKVDGDQALVTELTKQGADEQKLRHMQAFSTAPVDDILAVIADELPAIEQKHEVSALVSKWDSATLAQHPGAEQIDVTPDLIDACHPTDAQRHSAAAIQKSKPISQEKAASIGK